MNFRAYRSKRIMTLLRRDSSAPARRHGQAVERRAGGTSTTLADAMGEVKACLHYDTYEDGTKMQSRRRTDASPKDDAKRQSTAIERAKKDFERIDNEVQEMEEYLFGPDALRRHQKYVDSRVRMTEDDKRIDSFKHGETVNDVVEYSCYACLGKHSYDWKFDAMPYTYGMVAKRAEDARPEAESPPKAPRSQRAQSAPGGRRPAADRRETEPKKTPGMMAFRVSYVYDEETGSPAQVKVNKVPIDPKAQA